MITLLSPYFSSNVKKTSSFFLLLIIIKLNFFSSIVGCGVGWRQFVVRMAHLRIKIFLLFPFLVVYFSGRSYCLLFFIVREIFIKIELDFKFN